MVVDDEFDFIRASFSPDEAETPLRIDANAVLSTTVADEPLQPVPRRDSQVLDVVRRMDQLELPQSRSLHRSVDVLDVLLKPDALGLLVAERSGHATMA